MLVVLIYWMEASKEIGLDVNAEKTKYLVMFREQQAGKNHEIKRGKKHF
jgi:hypothetical protein